MASETAQRRQGAIRQYLETWAAAFAEVLQQVAAPDGRAAVEGDETRTARARQETQGGVRLSLQCSGSLAGRQMVSVSTEGALALARLQTGDAAGEARPGAATQFLRQAAGQAARRLRGPDGDEVQFQEQNEAEAVWSSAAGTAIRLEGVTPEPVTVLVEIDETLAEALAARMEAGGAARDPRAGSSAEAGGTNLDLLLDVELEASIRFGQKELLLKDVLNLRPGSVVELARQVNEPAELLVAGRLMARGEVVVVEGNYGLRITEILGPAERMAAIRG